MIKGYGRNSNHSSDLLSSFSMSSSFSLFFFSSRLLLATIVVFMIPRIGSASGCYNSIFSFGDSFIDTGNFLFLQPGDPIGHFPYGETYFQHPTGRCCNGRVILDFIAEDFGIPLLLPYLPFRHRVKDLERGANFAVAGATALEVGFFQERGIEGLSTNCSLEVQLNWFMEFLPSLCFSASNCWDMLRSSLFLVGTFGGNDYSLVFLRGWSIPEIKKTVVPQLVTTIGSAVDALIEHGASTVMVPGVIPIGCFLTIFGTPSKENTDPLTGCLKNLNELVTYHNQQLQKELNYQREKHPYATIIYADYYNAVLAVYRSPFEFGFTEGALRACCGGGGPYNYNSSAPCGTPEATACKRPSLYWNWDGRHPTEAGHRLMATGLIEGPYAVPPLNSSCFLLEPNATHSFYE